MNFFFLYRFWSLIFDIRVRSLGRGFESGIFWSTRGKDEQKAKQKAKHKGEKDQREQISKERDFEFNENKIDSLEEETFGSTFRSTRFKLRPADLAIAFDCRLCFEIVCVWKWETLEKK